jgi:rubredoxin
MTRYVCDVCTIFEYIVEIGDEETHIPPGTFPADFPDDWKCPVCGVDKTHLRARSRKRG